MWLAVVEMAGVSSVSFAMEEAVAKSARHRKRGLKEKGETSASRTLQAISERRREREERKDTRTAIEKVQGEKKPKKKKKEPVSGLLLALREKKEEENRLALGSKRWCRECKNAFEGDVCPNTCPPFMYRDDIPQ